MKNTCQELFSTFFPSVNFLKMDFPIVFGVKTAFLKKCVLYNTQKQGAENENNKYEVETNSDMQSGWCERRSENQIPETDLGADSNSIPQSRRNECHHKTVGINLRRRYAQSRKAGVTWPGSKSTNGNATLGLSFKPFTLKENGRRFSLRSFLNISRLMSLTLPTLNSVEQMPCLETEARRVGMFRVNTSQKLNLVKLRLLERSAMSSLTILITEGVKALDMTRSSNENLNEFTHGQGDTCLAK